MTGQPRILALFGARVVFGAERENIESLAALREEGGEVLCVVRHESWNDHIPAALAEHGLRSAKVPYIDGWLPGWRLWALARNPIAFIQGNLRLLRIARAFKPTHIHAFNPLYVLSFILALTVLRIPMIYRSGDVPQRHRWFWRILWSYIVARTDRFVSVSKFISRQLESTGVSPEKISLIYGRPPKRITLKEHPPIDNSFRNIVFVGQIAEHKGPHLLVGAVCKLARSYPNLRLLIAGPITDWRGDDWARDLRARVAADREIRDKITFLGNVENIPSLLRCCEFLTVPSLWEEPLGLVVMEAKESGIPAVVFPRGGLPEMIQHGIDGFVCLEPTPEALEEGLRYYLEKPGRARQHGIAARNSLVHLGAQDFAKNWRAVYGNGSSHIPFVPGTILTNAQGR